MTAICAKNITFGYGKKIILKEVSLSVSHGEIVAITGKSGVGKSTLAYILGGVIPRSIEKTYLGKVEICGVDILKMSKEEQVRKIGIVFQNPDTQIFSQSVENEIAFAMENLNFTPSKMREKIVELLAFVNLTTFEKRNPAKLSGGQKQLVALCSVLATDPEILIFDEAMSMLDSESARKILNLMLRLKADGKAIVYVEHNEKRLEIADKICVLESGVLKVGGKI